MSSEYFKDTNTVYRLEMISQLGVSSLFGPFRNYGAAKGMKTRLLKRSRYYSFGIVQELHGEWQAADE